MSAVGLLSHSACISNPPPPFSCHREGSSSVVTTMVDDTAHARLGVSLILVDATLIDSAWQTVLQSPVAPIWAFYQTTLFGHLLP
jgi:hypothetical protein